MTATEKRYKLVPKENNTDDITETVYWTVKEILEYINSDRNPDWIDYTENDWQQGLEFFGYPYKYQEQ